MQWVNHYDAVGWAQLHDWNVKWAVLALGWDEESWNQLRVLCESKWKKGVEKS